MAHRATLLAHPATLLVNCATLLAHRETLFAHRATLLAHRATLLVHRATLLTHRETLLAHRVPRPPVMEYMYTYLNSVIIYCVWILCTQDECMQKDGRAGRGIESHVEGERLYQVTGRIVCMRLSTSRVFSHLIRHWTNFG